MDAVAALAMDAARLEAEHLFHERSERISQGGGRLRAMSSDSTIGFDDMGPMRCHDDPSSCSEDECDADDGLEDEEEGPVPVRTRLTRRRSWGKQARKTPVPRAVVDELHIVSLVKAYRFEYAAFCRGKKRAPKQVVPGKVWEKVYRDHYLATFLDSAFGEDTLKKHLREQLGELNIGIADDGLRPNLQDEVIATQVRSSDCSATRNILRMRQSFVGGHPSVPLPQSRPSRPITSAVPPVTEQTSTRTTTPAPPVVPSRPTTPSQVTSSAATSGDSQRLTKSDMLQKQAEAVCAIATDFHSTVEKQSLLMDAKRAKQEEQTLLMSTKRARHQLTLLREGRDIGVITEEDYKARVADLLKF